MTAWMFPGQGAQRAGMAKDLSKAKDLFLSAEKILDADLYKLCASDDTKHWPMALLQPAIFTTCVAVGRALADRGLAPDAVVGHSLGEYAALVVGASIEFEDALRLVDVRGKGMAEAGRRHPGGMAAIIGLDETTVSDICIEVGDVWVANVNAADQTVISGTDKGLTEAASQCVQAGAGRVVRLEVPVAAHSPLMEPAAAKFKKALDNTQISSPVCAFYSGVDAAAHEDPSEIRQLLGDGLLSRVRFADTLSAMGGDGITTFIEAGPGRALRGLVRRTLPNANVDSVSNDEGADELAMAGAVK